MWPFRKKKQEPPKEEDVAFTLSYEAVVLLDQYESEFGKLMWRALELTASKHIEADYVQKVGEALITPAREYVEQLE